MNFVSSSTEVRWCRHLQCELNNLAYINLGSELNNLYIDESRFWAERFYLHQLSPALSYTILPTSIKFGLKLNNSAYILR